MPVIEGLSFRYALHELAPGRLPLRRWRWELWHGERLEAAGWRLSERDASRALRLHASRVGHRVFSLAPPAEAASSLPSFAPGTTVRVRHGAIAFALVPKQLDHEPAWA
jgi:hypothetical protein